MISILVAYTKKDRVIGNRGSIPWNLPSERVRFKEICKDKFIIMGRKSFEEIGHRLPYCTIVIVSRSLKNAPEGCLVARSFEEGVRIAGGRKVDASLDGAGADIGKVGASLDEAGAGLGVDAPLTKPASIPEILEHQEILVAGGGEIYRQALSMPQTSTIYATEIDAEYQGDVTFPSLEYYGTWKKTEEESKSELGVNYKYVTYKRLTYKAGQQ